MIIIMDPRATGEEIEAIQQEITNIGFIPFINPGVERKVIAVLGEFDVSKADLSDHFQAMPGVARVELISDLWKLASRAYHPENSIVQIGNVKIGGNEIIVAAGPCSIESEEQMLGLAHEAKASGAKMLRGGAFKPRSSPYAFQGMGEEGLKILAKAGKETGLPVVTEIMDAHELDVVCKYADVLQIGARNMQNYSLLKKVGTTRHPVVLKRGPGSKIKDLLMSAEYIMAGGNQSVILCERGITTFEDATRNTTDINAVPVLKNWTHLPVILDPSHATGNWHYVGSIAKAGIAAGADGLLIETHSDPAHAMSDGPQSLKPKKFSELMGQLARIAEAVDRSINL
ncbi:MAG: 3-deoxy-7-phosphoheptulonate synthase [Armatimonadetes bacterium]|nr:3-deoxy-7-phosphoheptulonate synthase [Armatimonadota bacterium]